MKEMMQERMVKFLVQKMIFCPMTEQVLDYRTCTVVVDDDGDPVGVYAPEVGPAMSAEVRKSLAAKGLHIRD